MSEDTNKDNLFSRHLDEVVNFKFDDSVVKVFPDMIKRSVPGYTTILHMIGQLTSKYALSGSKIYDFGCSLGASTLSMRHALGSADVEIVGIDNSKEMLARCQQVINADCGEIPVRLLCSDIQKAEIENASVCVLNFTLQFIPLKDRHALLEKIFKGMLPGGILILSEKLMFTDSHHNDLMVELHHNFKRANGYSDLEISQKRQAIEDILVPESLEDHYKRLKNIGFTGIDVWFQCFNFASFIAFKPQDTLL